MKTERPEQQKKTIGRAEKLSFPELGFEDVYARVDTGAKTSSVWASKVIEDNGQLSVIFFGEGAAQYSGKPVVFSAFDKAIVSSSTGEIQKRYKVQLFVKLKGKKVRAWFTLADRSTQVYPVLIGRNVLLGKFIVDVKRGQILKDEERVRTESLQAKGDTEEP